jgi:hypothetical protein
MWTVQQRQTHERAGLRCPSDLTDGEWGLVEPLIPPAKRGGRKRSVDIRAVLDGIFYVLATGDRQARSGPGLRAAAQALERGSSLYANDKIGRARSRGW